MNKLNKKIISSQARYLEKIVGHVQSIRLGRKMRKDKRCEIKPQFQVYSRETRVDIYKNNGVHYKPANIKSAILGMNDNQKARLMRLVYRQEGPDIGGDGQRQYSIWGNDHSVKDIICIALFKKVKTK